MSSSLSLSLKMEQRLFSEIAVPVYETTLCYVPNHSNLHGHDRKDLRSHKKVPRYHDEVA